MVRILIVDDEEMVRDGLCDIIQYLNIEGISALETAADGEDALNKIAACQPDIVITDLNMPKVDGLTLIAQLVAKSYKMKIIVISGYDEFHLVKESFKLGITDYLLKPVHTEELREALISSIETLQQEQILQDQGKAEQSQSWIEKGSKDLGFALQQAEEGDDGEERLEQLFARQGMARPHAHLMVAIISVLERQSESVSWQMKLAVDLLNEHTADTPLVIYPLFNKHHDLVLWINFQAQPDMRHFMSSMRQHYSSSMFIIACGRAFPAQGHLWQAYQSAHQVSRYKLVSKAYTILDDSVYHKRCMASIETAELKRLVDIVEGARKDEVQSFIADHFNDQALGKYTFEAISGMYDTIMQVIQWLPSKKRSIYSFEQPEQLRIYLKTCIFQTIDARRELLSGSNIVEVAKRYVQEHLLDEINMAVVANYCNVSYHHFSKLFKEAVGVNFQDYVTQCRMAYAKQALQGLNVKVNEVASRLGYSNPKNFTRVFKNYYGMSPKEYQDSLAIK